MERGSGGGQAEGFQKPSGRNIGNHISFDIFQNVAVFWWHERLKGACKQGCSFIGW
jgi:hypothetical protein